MFCISLANLRKWVKIPYNLLKEKIINHNKIIDRSSLYCLRCKITTNILFAIDACNIISHKTELSVYSF